jgi:hypothetical protein
LSNDPDNGPDLQLRVRGVRSVEEMRADVMRAREALASALRVDLDQIADEGAIRIAAGAWWIEDVLARPDTDPLLGDQGGAMLKELARQPLPSKVSRLFEEELRTLREEAALARRQPDDHVSQRLLLRLLAIYWTLATGRPPSRADRSDTPLTRFLEAMLDPSTGLPGISGHPAAVALRNSRTSRTMASIARGRNK